MFNVKIDLGEVGGGGGGEKGLRGGRALEEKRKERYYEKGCKGG